MKGTSSWLGGLALCVAWTAVATAPAVAQLPADTPAFRLDSLRVEVARLEAGGVPGLPRSAEAGLRYRF